MDLGIINKKINKVLQELNIPVKKSCSCGCNKCGDKKKLNETKEEIKGLIRKIIKEETTTALFKMEGVLTTDTKNRNQKDILSDIRSISGITTVTTRDSKYSDDSDVYSNNFKVLLSIKIDPHPFIGHGGFGKEQLKKIYSEIKKVNGVIGFKLIKKPYRI